MVSIKRNGSISLNGVIDKTTGATLILIKSKDALTMSKKFVNWWNGGNWQITKSAKLNLIQSDNFNISLDEHNMIINENGVETIYQICKAKLNNAWHYIMIEINNNCLSFVLMRRRELHIKTDDVLINKMTVNFNHGDLTTDNLYINNCGMRAYMTNIRMRKFNNSAFDRFDYDMHSKLVANESQYIICDNPSGINKSRYITEIK